MKDDKNKNDQQEEKKKEDVMPQEDNKTTEEEKVKSKEEELEERIQQLENELKYAVADYRNRERKIEEEKREFVKFANRELLLRLLPAFDTLFLADKYIEDQGLKMSVKKLVDVLQEVGVTRIETEKKKYDPHIMECIEVVEGKEDEVVAEVRPGFLLYGKVLQPAHVKVGKKVEK